MTRFGSVCSGIEGRDCAKCGAFHPWENFHRQPSGRNGRHAYCKACANAVQKASRTRNYTPEQKRKWHLSTRYGITPEQVDAMHAEQSGNCALCVEPLGRFHVDHCHATGRVRGLLCHRCNIRIGGWDDAAWRANAMRYLGL